MIRMAAIGAVTSARPLSVCGMLAAARANIQFTNCLAGRPAALGVPRETSEGAFSWHSAGFEPLPENISKTSAAGWRAGRQRERGRASEQRRERGRRLVGEGWGDVGGGGERRGAVEEGRGRDVGAAGTAEYVCAANLTRTFEKAKSQREHCRRRGSAALQTAGTETGAG